MGGPSTFSIRQLTGDRHELLLRGRALPSQGVSFRGTMRTQVVHYPGSPTATIQVLGPQEEPTTAGGAWRDIFFGEGGSAEAIFDGERLADAMATVAAADMIRRQGQLVEVAWDAIVRRGVLADFRHTWVRREDVTWEVSFEWISQGEDEQPVTFSRPIAQADFAARLRGSMDALNEALAGASLPYAAEVQAMINGARAAAEAATTAAQEASEAVLDKALEPAAAARRSVSIVSAASAAAGSIVSAAESRVARALVPGDPAAMTHGKAFQAEAQSRALRRAARALRNTAVQDLVALQVAAGGTAQVIGRVVAREGQDLRELAVQFYGHPDQWRRLAAYNGRSGSLLHAGDLVVVPAS